MSGEVTRVAVIDIGTNSARLLVADVAGGGCTHGRAPQHGLRGWGAASTSPGGSSAEAIEAACEAIASYVATMQELERGVVDAIATSAVRDADNGSAFVAELRERFALSARVLDGEEEARLTYLGATSERHAGGADPGHRHRRRLDRADRRHRRRDRLPRLPAGRASSATPSATSPPTRPPRSSWKPWPPTCAG